ncbi:Flagellar hook-associated protein flgL [Nitrospira tepida]|uniref:Flagellar hook-associated protein flgL n=1 Tax=Nitrospira tepida TaxID=2973512 RepID=A0AA86N1Z0_9BACT|nr:flagellar hook-associated protein FlgL [Nitrospira tepida]CAI4032991.1 Flagellar hook-associated protein flgL [Nitrospira tepida]
MRVADSQVFNTLFGNMQRTRSRILVAQEQISSQKRLLKPSDDPSSFGQVLAGRTELSRNEQWSRNITFGRQRLELADGTLTQVTTLLIRVKELTVQAASGTTTAEQRVTIAQEVRQLHRHLMQLANTELNGQRIFSGTKTDVAPYVLTAGDTVIYQGNGERHAVEVGEGQTIDDTMPGSQVFSGPTANLFDSLRDLLASLEGNNQAGIETGVGDVDRAMAQVNNAQGQIGALVNRMDVAGEWIARATELVTRTISDHEDADLAEAISDLSRHELALEATNATLSRMFTTSLLNFLR